MIPLYAPDGTLGQVPYDQMHAAIQAGGKMAVQMSAPDGTKGYVPADRLSEATKAGGTVIPYNVSTPGAPKEGFWPAVGSELKGMAQGVGQMLAEGPPNTPEAMIRQAGANAPAMAQRAQEGRSLPYQALAGVAPSLGVNPAGMEEAARQGDPNAVLGHAVGNAIPYAAPLAGEAVGRLAGAAGVGDAAGTIMRSPETNQLRAPLKVLANFPGKYLGVPEAVEAITPDNPAFTATQQAKTLTVAQEAALKENAIREARAARQKALADRQTAKEGEAVPITQSPYYRQWQVAQEAEQAARQAVPLKDSPYYAQNVAKAKAASDAAKQALDADMEARKAVPVSQSPYANQKQVPPSPFGNAISTNPVELSSLGKAQLPQALPQGNPTPFGQPVMVNKFAPPEPSRIATSESPAPPINKTYVSYDAKTLVKLAKGGDLNAIRELIRNPRGVDISDIPGVKYLMEPGRRGVVYGGPSE